MFKSHFRRDWVARSVKSPIGLSKQYNHRSNICISHWPLRCYVTRQEKRASFEFHSPSTSTLHRHQDPMKISSSPVTIDPKLKPFLSQNIQVHAIKGTSASLPSPQPLLALLKDLEDGEPCKLTMIQPQKPGLLGPIVKVTYDQAATSSRATNKSLKPKQPKVPEQEVRFSFAAMQHDIQYRLDRAQKHLQKGGRLVVVLCPRKGTGWLASLGTPEHRQNMLKDIMDRLGIDSDPLVSLAMPPKHTDHEIKFIVQGKKPKPIS